MEFENFEKLKQEAIKKAGGKFCHVCKREITAAIVTKIETGFMSGKEFALFYHWECAPKEVVAELLGVMEKDFEEAV